MAVVNVMNHAFLRPEETLGDQYSEFWSMDGVAHGIA